MGLPAALIALSLPSWLSGQAGTDSGGKREMIFIPPGEFTMGTSAEEAAALAAEYGVHPSLFALESPQRRVDVKGFLIDRYPVTNVEYQRFVKATGHAAPLTWANGAYPAGQDDYPVTGLPWSHANDYARWAGKRLPTAEEWEKAARGADGRRYSWGNDWREDACWVDDPSCPQALPRTTPVGAFPQGASPYGVLDLCGNVAEWTSTQAVPEDTAHNWHWYVVKGAGGAHRGRYHFRAAAVAFSAHESRWHDWLGFRCARDADRDPGDLAPPRPTPSLPPPPTAPGPDGQVFGTRPIEVTPTGGAGIVLRPPCFPEGGFSLYVPEQIGAQDLPLAWGLPHEPFQWQRSPDGTRAQYECVWKDTAVLTITLQGLTDAVDLTLALRNLSGKPFTNVWSNVCFNIHASPYFVDMERNRTMAWTDEGPVSLLKLPASGPGEPMHGGWSLAPAGEPARAAEGRVRYPFIFQVSRDGKWTLAQAYGEAVNIASNAHYSCLHTRPAWPDIPPGEERRVDGKLYFLRGGPEQLLARWKKDYGK